MKFDEANNKWIPETEEEQNLFDYAFGKGVSQGKKAASKSEETENTMQQKAPAFDMEQFATLIQQTVNQAVNPLQEKFNSMQEQSAKNFKEKVISKQAKKLPKAYEVLIEGNTELEIKTSYDKVFDQYKEELKDAGINLNFGAPTPNGEDGQTKAPVKSFKDMNPQEKIDLYKSDAELYAKLAQQ